MLPPDRGTEEKLKLNGWNRLLLFLQQAVCFYVEMDNKKLRRTDSEKDALLAMERAKSFVSQNTALFEGVIEDSPLYQGEPEANPEENHKSEITNQKCESRPGGVFDPLGSFYS